MSAIQVIAKNDKAPVSTPAEPPGTGRLAGSAPAVAVDPEPLPVLIGACRGWLHARPGAGGPDGTAVLLCPALGWDGLHSYHGLRVLADELAASGYAVLRLQYRGTADSGDLPEEAEHWSDWQADVSAAADWLRYVTGAGRLVLGGLKLGAALAATVAARRDDVAGLALLAPVLRGKSYMRQLAMEARLEGGMGSAQATGLDFHEFRFTDATIAAIGAVAVRALPLRPQTAVLILPQAPSVVVDDCAKAWGEAGLAVHVAPFDGLAPLLQEAIHVDPPAAEFGALRDWLAEHVPPGPPGPATANGLPPTPVLVLPGCTEEPVRFGRDRRFAGILCQPRTGVTPKAVLINNTGRDPHYGIARLGTELARSLAEQGIASLRIDFAGLGDSPPSAGPDGVLSPLFASRGTEMAAALDLLEARGYRDFAVQGLCSGAYHAFSAALIDPRVRTLLLVNLASFQWSGESSASEVRWRSAPIQRVFQRMADYRVWLRALRGDSKVREVVSGQFARLAGKVNRRSGSATATPAEAIAGLSRRGVRSLFLYSPGDPGLDSLETTFGRSGEQLASVPGADVRVVEGMDHVLSGRVMRAAAVREMVQFLQPGAPVSPRPI